MSDIKTIAIIGGGLIGASWAALFTANGIDVMAWDPDVAARDQFRGRMNAARRQLAMLGRRGRGRLKIVARLKAALAGRSPVKAASRSANTAGAAVLAEMPVRPARRSAYEACELAKMAHAVPSAPASIAAW